MRQFFIAIFFLPFIVLISTVSSANELSCLGRDSSQIPFIVLHGQAEWGQSIYLKSNQFSHTPQIEFEVFKILPFNDHVEILARSKNIYFAEGRVMNLQLVLPFREDQSSQLKTTIPTLDPEAPGAQWVKEESVHCQVRNLYRIQNDEQKSFFELAN